MKTAPFQNSEKQLRVGLHLAPRKRKNKFVQLDVCTYICVVKLEQAIQSTKFKSETHKAGLNILYTAWWLKTSFSQALKEYGLTHEQYNVLRILKGKHPEQMCVRDIACRMIEKSSNVPRIVDRLEIKKLVKRSVSSFDKRETMIQLTAAGLLLLEVTTKKADELFDMQLCVTDEEAKQLNELLEKLRQKEL
ncbi:MAG: hypothetical protein B7Y15_02830 [Bacteroidetes bacterium 24-39-8]|nr:MAG: hypothetical protein B7Y15_02830 [Bacteroidetes bacterium 24-39-8]OZA66655.1 MAG: hypothetical protein B7X72_05410 [Sphingobacteriia bacterium 39-39-8]